MVTDTYDALTGDTKASRQANPIDSFSYTISDDNP
jgi:hypothetical protein